MRETEPAWRLSKQGQLRPLAYGTHSHSLPSRHAVRRSWRGRRRRPPTSRAACSMSWQRRGRGSRGWSGSSRRSARSRSRWRRRSRCAGRRQGPRFRLVNLRGGQCPCSMPGLGLRMLAAHTQLCSALPPNHPSTHRPTHPAFIQELAQERDTAQRKKASAELDVADLEDKLASSQGGRPGCRLCPCCAFEAQCCCCCEKSRGIAVYGVFLAPGHLTAGQGPWVQCQLCQTGVGHNHPVPEKGAVASASGSSLSRHGPLLPCLPQARVSAAKPTWRSWSSRLRQRRRKPGRWTPAWRRHVRSRRASHRPLLRPNCGPCRQGIPGPPWSCSYGRSCSALAQHLWAWTLCTSQAGPLSITLPCPLPPRAFCRGPRAASSPASSAGCRRCTTSRAAARRWAAPQHVVPGLVGR